MTESVASWTPAIVAIVIGLALGLVVAFVSRRDDADDVDELLSDLQAKHGNLIFQLRELRARGGEFTADRRAEEQHDLEQQAVAVLKQRDKLLAKQTKGPRAKTPASRLTWIVGAALVVGIGIWLALPTPAVESPQGAVTPGALADPELEAVWARLQDNPADVEALVRAAQLLLAKGLQGEAAPAIERALQLEPEHPGALLTYAELLAGSGNIQEALGQVDAVLRKHPDHLQAWSLKAGIALKAGHTDVARQSLEEYIKLAPDGPSKTQARQMLEQGMLEARQTLEQGMLDEHD